MANGFNYKIDIEAIDNASKVIQSVQKDIKKAQQTAKQGLQFSTNIQNIKSNIKSVNTEAKSLGNTLNNALIEANKRISKMGSKISKFGKKLGETGTSHIKSGSTKVVAGVGTATTLAMPIIKAVDFQSSMLSVKAIISGAYGDSKEDLAKFENDFASLSKKAKELGATTSFSASEVADGMKYMSMAGFKATDTVKAMAGVLSLATSGQVDLATASDIGSNVLSGFGLKADQMNRVADLMAKTITTSNTTVTSLGESFKMVAPLSASLGVSIEETASMIGLLGNAGINGTMAGNALKRMMLNLSAPTSRVKKAMSSINLNAFDDNGKMKSMAKIMGELQGKLKGMSDAQKTAIMKDIFGSEALPSAMVLLKQGQKGISSYTKSLEKAKGTGKKMQDIQLSGVGGSIKILQSSIEGLFILIGEKFTPILKVAIDKITAFIGSVSNWIKNNQELTKTIFTIVGIISGLVILFGTIQMALGSILFITSKVISIFNIFGHITKIITAGQKIYQGVLIATNVVQKAFTIGTKFMINSFKSLGKGILTATKSVLRFTLALLTNPITWIVIGIIALIGALYELYKHFDIVKAYVLSLWDSFTHFTVVQSAMKFISTFIVNLENIIINAITSISNIFSTLYDIFLNITNSIATFFSNMEQNISNSINSVFLFISATKDNIILLFDDIGRAVSEIIISAFSYLSNILNDIISVFSNIGTSINSVINNIVNFISNLEVLKTTSNALTNFFNSLGSNLSGFMDTLISPIKYVIDFVDKLINKFKIVSDVKNTISNIIDKTSNIGGNIKSNINSAVSSVKNTIGGIWDNITGVVNDDVNINKNENINKQSKNITDVNINLAGKDVQVEAVTTKSTNNNTFLNVGNSILGELF